MGLGNISLQLKCLDDISIALSCNVVNVSRCERNAGQVENLLDRSLVQPSIWDPQLEVYLGEVPWGIWDEVSEEFGKCLKEVGLVGLLDVLMVKRAHGDT